MIQVPEFKKPVFVGTQFEIFDVSGVEIASVYNERDAHLISQMPNMVMMLQRVLKDYEEMLDEPKDSHIYTDIHKVLDDADHWRNLMK